jgi:hypothetical protein
MNSAACIRKELVVMLHKNNWLKKGHKKSPASQQSFTE